MQKKQRSSRKDVEPQRKALWVLCGFASAFDFLLGSGLSGLWFSHERAWLFLNLLKQSAFYEHGVSWFLGMEIFLKVVPLRAIRADQRADNSPAK